jgi:hypothetical protein
MPNINPGNYRATALDAQLGVTQTGKEFIAVNFRLIDAPEVTLQYRGYFTEKTADRTIESLRYCGWTGSDIDTVSFPGGNEVMLDVKDETYEKDGVMKTHSKVAWVNAARGPSVKGALDTAAAKIFAAKMKGAIVAFDLKNPADDSIPF